MWHIVRIWWVVHLFKKYAPVWKRFYKQLRISRELENSEWKKELNDEQFSMMIKSMAADQNRTDYSPLKVKKGKLIGAYLHQKWMVWRPKDRIDERYVKWEENVKSAIESAVSSQYGLFNQKPMEKYYDDELILTEDGKKFDFIKLLGLLLNEAGDFIQGMTKLKQLLIGSGIGAGLLFIIQWLLSL